ncbi:MAG: Hsp20/alpha crystallin family protein [Rubrobacteraceae bacterium]|nr:Hsp20/alpha crystallin family protein [Rubrobacteraceae bacterium]
MGRTRNPFRGLMDHMSEMSRMREYAEGGGTEDHRRTHATAWVPTADIFARGGDLVIRCELAGVEREDVEVSLAGGVLTVDGERRGEPEDVSYYARERQYGRFRRSMNLPEGIKGNRISAGFENGLLEVTVTGGADQDEPERIRIASSPG